VRFVHEAYLVRDGAGCSSARRPPRPRARARTERYLAGGSRRAAEGICVQLARDHLCLVRDLMMRGWHQWGGATPTSHRAGRRVLAFADSKSARCSFKCKCECHRGPALGCGAAGRGALLRTHVAFPSSMGDASSLPPADLMDELPLGTVAEGKMFPSVNKVIAQQLANRARNMSDEELRDLFEDLLNAKSPPPPANPDPSSPSSSQEQANEEQPFSFLQPDENASEPLAAVSPSDGDPVEEEGDVAHSGDAFPGFIQSESAPEKPAAVDAAKPRLSPSLFESIGAKAKVASAVTLALSAASSLYFLWKTVWSNREDTEATEQKKSPEEESRAQPSMPMQVHERLKADPQGGNVLWTRQDEEGKAARNPLPGEAKRSGGGVIWERREDGGNGAPEQAGAFTPPDNVLEDNVE